MKKGKEIFLGSIFLLTLSIMYVGISFLKGHDIFSKYNTYYIVYQNVSGLSTSSPVLVNGVRVGIVGGISYDCHRPDRIIVRMGVNKQLLIPRGSCCLLVNELLGTVNIQLKLSSDTGSYYAPGDTLSGVLSEGIRSQFSKLMPQLIDMLPAVDSILTGINRVIQDPAIGRTLNNAEALTTEAETTLKGLSTTISQISTLVDTYQGVGEKLDTLTTKFNTLSDEERLDNLLNYLDGTLRNLYTLSDDLMNSDGTAQRLINDPELYNQLNRLCMEASRLIEDIKENPSRYIRLFGRSR